MWSCMCVRWLLCLQRTLVGWGSQNESLEIPLTGYAVFLSGPLQVLLPKHCFLKEALTDAPQSAWVQRPFLLFLSLAGKQCKPNPAWEPRILPVFDSLLCLLLLNKCLLPYYGSLKLSEILCGTRQCINKRIKQVINVCWVEWIYSIFPPQNTVVTDKILGRGCWMNAWPLKLESKAGSQQSWCRWTLDAESPHGWGLAVPRGDLVVCV